MTIDNMDWVNPLILVLLAPLVAALVLFHAKTLHPMAPARRWTLMGVRAALVLIALLALAGPAWQQTTDQRAVIFVMDHSQSQGESGLRQSYEVLNRMAGALAGDTFVGVVSAGASAKVLRLPEKGWQKLEPDATLLETDGRDTDLESAVAVARGLFPPGTARRIVILGDGIETRGDLNSAAQTAAVSEIKIDVAPVAGEARPDVRVVRVKPSKSRVHEGASLSVTAEIESSIAGTGKVRLFENGIEVEVQDIAIEVGQQRNVSFVRTPDERNLYNYRVSVEGFENDAIPDNDSAVAFVEVRGRPLLLYVEGEKGQSDYLADAMAREGIRLQVRPPEAMPQKLGELAAYDGIIFSDVPAFKVTEKSMSLVRDYVEQLGGGFLMVGGRSSFGVGGYYRTPIEDILPVKIQSPNKEEKYATALALVLDRSGSMSGQKIEICKSAAIAAIELLNRKDFVGVVAFDSNARWIVPMTRVNSKNAIASQVATLNSGGGTNIHPGMVAAQQALRGVRARAKHMIVLTDGQTSGAAYHQLAAAIHKEGVTISTVGIGQGAAMALLQTIAQAGGGQSYHTLDPANLPRIFTQDTMTHIGRLIREEAFKPRQVEQHAMLKGWTGDQAPSLLGYVKTHRKATTQVPMVTDTDDPLLAHWRYGLGKVTAFTSDCKSRWSALWISSWPDGYSQFWAQVLREMAREPQGQLMDIHLQKKGHDARVIVDLMEDSVRFRNDAIVDADVYFVPANALGTSLKAVGNVRMEQEGPGRYAADFRLDQPGVYLVRARSGAEMVSAGIVQNISGEAATGRVNRSLFDSVSKMTGGVVIDAAKGELPVDERLGHAKFVELGPYLLRMLLLLFLVDVAIRRWENLVGMVEFAKKVAK